MARRPGLSPVLPSPPLALQDPAYNPPAITLYHVVTLVSLSWHVSEDSSSQREAALNCSILTWGLASDSIGDRCKSRIPQHCVPHEAQLDQLSSWLDFLQICGRGCVTVFPPRLERQATGAMLAALLGPCSRCSTDSINQIPTHQPPNHGSQSKPKAPKNIDSGTASQPPASPHRQRPSSQLIGPPPTSPDFYRATSEPFFPPRNRFSIGSPTIRQIEVAGRALPVPSSLLMLSESAEWVPWWWPASILAAFSSA